MTAVTTPAAKPAVTHFPVVGDTGMIAIILVALFSLALATTFALRKRSR